MQACLIDSLIFDLDGTLWDSTNTVLMAWKKALCEFKFIKKDISRDDIEGIFGMQYSLIGEKLFPYLHKSEQEQVMHRCFECENETISSHGGILYKDIIEVLNVLSTRYPLYIVSNCQPGYIEAFLNFYRLHDLFKDHECAGNTGLPKHKNIEIVIDRNKINNPVYIGDTASYYDASKKNGIPFIHAAYGFGKADAADFTITTPRDLLSMF